MISIEEVLQQVTESSESDFREIKMISVFLAQIAMKEFVKQILEDIFNISDRADDKKEFTMVYTQERIKNRINNLL